MKVHTIRGRPEEIGDIGGFPPLTIGSDSAGIAPEQWGASNGKDIGSENASQISGVIVTAQGALQFNNVAETIGGLADRWDLMYDYPDSIIIELPGMPALPGNTGSTGDFGDGIAVLMVPTKLPCPQPLDPFILY